MTEPAFTLLGAPVSLLEAAAFALALAGVATSIVERTITWPLSIAASALYGVLFAASHLPAQAALQGVFIAVAVYGWAQWRSDRRSRAIARAPTPDPAGGIAPGSLPARLTGDSASVSPRRATGYSTSYSTGHSTGHSTDDSAGDSADDAAGDSAATLSDHAPNHAPNHASNHASNHATHQSSEPSAGSLPARAAVLPIARLAARDRWRAAAAWLLGWALLAGLLLRTAEAAAPLLEAMPTAGSLLGQWLLARKCVETWPVWVLVNIVSVALFAGQGLLLTAVLYGLLALLALVGWRRWAVPAPAVRRGLV